MKLTNMIRDAFVRAAIADVPKVDYAEQALSIANKAMDDLRAKTFPGIDLNANREWMNQTSVKMPGSLSNLYTVAPGYNTLEKMPKVWEKLEELNQADIAQAQKLAVLERSLRGVAYSVTTRKALADALPEFEKHLPADTPTATRNLPVVTNVVAAFVQAGWPKTQPNQGA